MNDWKREKERDKNQNCPEHRKQKALFIYVCPENHLAQNKVKEKSPRSLWREETSVDLIPS